MSRRKRERVFFETNTQGCTGCVTFCYSLISRTAKLWSVTLNGHAWVDSLGAFINSTRWIGSCVLAIRILVTKTGLIVCRYTVRLTQYDRLSQQHNLFYHKVSLTTVSLCHTSGQVSRYTLSFSRTAKLFRALAFLPLYLLLKIFIHRKWKKIAKS